MERSHNDSRRDRVYPDPVLHETCTTGQSLHRPISILIRILALCLIACEPRGRREATTRALMEAGSALFRAYSETVLIEGTDALLTALVGVAPLAARDLPAEHRFANLGG